MRPKASKPARNRNASASVARKVSTASGHPLDGLAVATRFEEIFAHYRHVVLAVSGGVDSMAMMHLAALWRAARPASNPAQSAPIFSVATVDHGLRPESAAEAEAVKEIAVRLGFKHTTLVWTGPKPATGIQAAARDARYRLIYEHLDTHRLGAVATAHTSDDQAETLLMRLARGSGVDGLAGMKDCKLVGAISLLRPMLSFAKADLIATLHAKGETWLEDPSNERQEFERVRLRQLRGNFEAAGLSNQAIALSARRLGRARMALDELAAVSVEQAPDEFRVDELGYAEFSWPWLTCLPAEIRLRILSRVVTAIGGALSPVSLSGLEAMTEGIDWTSPAGRTLGGAVFSAGEKPDWIVVTREYGRKTCPLPTLGLKSGHMADWDNRFTLINSIDLGRDFRVSALGREGLAALKAALSHGGASLPAHPAAALMTIPSFWDGEKLAAVPLLNYFADGMDPIKLQSYLTTWPFPS